MKKNGRYAGEICNHQGECEHDLFVETRPLGTPKNLDELTLQIMNIPGFLFQEKVPEMIRDYIAQFTTVANFKIDESRYPKTILKQLFEDLTKRSK